MEIYSRAFCEKKQVMVVEKFKDQDSAEKLAKDAITENSFRYIRFYGRAVGNGRIKPDQIIKVNGLAGRFQGQYRIKRARHIYKAEYGYITDFECVRNAN